MKADPTSKHRTINRSQDESVRPPMPAPGGLLLLDKAGRPWPQRAQPQGCGKPESRHRCLQLHLLCANWPARLLCGPTATREVLWELHACTHPPARRVPVFKGNICIKAPELDQNPTLLFKKYTSSACSLDKSKPRTCGFPEQFIYLSQVLR